MTRRPRTGPDDGTTLAEVMVAMGVTSVVLTIFTAAMLLVYRSVTGVEGRSTGQNQLHTAFQQLDREIRYASGITPPSAAAVNGSWYVEFLGVNPATGAPVCRQLRLDASGVLQQLTWTPGAPPAAGTRGRTLASELVVPGGSVPPPFERQGAGSLPYAAGSAAGASYAPGYQRLRVRLTTRTGTATGSADVTFTALNTSRDTADPNICAEGRPQ